MKRGEPPENRKCLNCGTLVTACFGFALARDWVKVLNGEACDEIRELCGRCVEFVDPATIK